MKMLRTYFLLGVIVLCKAEIDVDVNKAITVIDESIAENVKDILDLKNTVVSLIQRIESLETENSLLRDEVGVIQVVRTYSEGSLEACSSSPCENNGTCIDVNVDTFVCMCRDGFFGITCGESYSGLSFLATFDVSTLIPVGDTIVFNYPVHNTGGHYDLNTGIYTTPIDGTYEFIFHILSFNDNNIVAYLVVDGTDVTYNWSFGDQTQQERLLESVIVLSLTTGQQVWVRPTGISSMYGANSNGMHSWFSGHFVHAL